MEDVGPLGAEVLPGEVEVGDVSNLHEVELVQERLKMGAVRQHSGLTLALRRVAQLTKSGGNIVCIVEIKRKSVTDLLAMAMKQRPVM